MGFSGVRVFNEKPATVFNGTSPTDAFLYMIVTDTTSEWKYTYVYTYTNCLLCLDAVFVIPDSLYCCIQYGRICITT